MNILYIHHSPIFGGASRSLKEAVTAFPKNAVNAYFISPKGTSTDEFSKIAKGIVFAKGISIFDHTKYSHYRKQRWLILLREFLYIFTTIFAIRRAKKKWQDVNFDAIHVNEICLLFPAYFAKLIFRKPLVMHCRSLQETEKGRLRIKFYRWFIDKYVDRIVAIDMYCFRTISNKEKAVIIQNGLNLPENHNVDFSTRRTKYILDSEIVVGYIGNFIECKGINELLGAAAKLKELNIKVKFLMIGPNVLGKTDFKTWLFDKLKFRENTLQRVIDFISVEDLDNFEFLGFISDLGEVIPQMDVLCFPSHLDAPGRPVFEAGFFGVPSIVAVSNPDPMSLIDGVSCICIKPRDVDSLVNAIVKLSESPDLLMKMGKEAYRLSLEHYDLNVNSLKLLKIYKSLQST